jgi:triosephosphate isomerase
MARRLMVAGNWKLHKTVDESVALAKELAQGFKRDDLDILISPTFPAIYPVAQAVQGSPVLVAGQNLYWQDQGAFTAEVSGPMLKAAGASHVIIGHSERRQFFGETEKTVSLRTIAALKAGLTPIVCVGETLEEREGNQTGDVLESQLAGGLAGLDIAQAKKLIIAYEPVWAIGTGMTATEDQADQAHALIRAWIGRRFDKAVENSARILYGGSVKPANAAGLLHREHVDGALVGGASLTAQDFLGIIEAV